MINKRWPGAMVMASDPTLEITRVPTGILTLDVLLKGGLARGRHTELYGGYNIGKTYVTYKTIATNQNLGLNCAFVDAEGTFDPKFAKQAGVDLKTLSLTDQKKLEHAERVVDFTEALLRSSEYDIIVVDSIASLLPKSELEKTMDEGSMGTEQAKLMSKALRKLTAANDKTALIFINQTREAIGVMFGKRSITSGGKAMGFYAATRLELVRTENIKKTSKRINPSNGELVKHERVTGHRVLVRVEKEKTGAAHQAEETTFVYDYDLGGIDPIEDLMYLGRRYSLIKKATGNKWWVDGYKEDQQVGRARFKKYLRDNRLICEELEEAIRDAVHAPLEIEDEEDED